MAGISIDVEDDTATAWIGRGLTRSSLSVTANGTDVEGRTVYTYEIATPEASETGNDLRTGVGTDHGPRAMLRTLVSFLAAAAESYDYGQRTGTPGENANLFTDEIVVWASLNDTELSELALELED